jgi:hypothetical protein
LCYNLQCSLQKEDTSGEASIAAPNTTIVAAATTITSAAAATKYYQVNGTY